MGRFSVSPYVRTYVRPSPLSRAQEPARQALDPASQASEPARLASEVARQASEPARQASEDLWGERTDGWMDGRTDGWKISPFHRALSPIRAAAPLKPNYNRKIV